MWRIDARNKTQNVDSTTSSPKGASSSLHPQMVADAKIGHLPFPAFERETKKITVQTEGPRLLKGKFKTRLDWRRFKTGLGFDWKLTNNMKKGKKSSVVLYVKGWIDERLKCILKLWDLKSFVTLGAGVILHREMYY